MDFYCFTDNLNLVFDCIKHNIYPILVFDQDKKLTQRTIKSSCHKYLPTSYNKSIYIDGNVIYFDNVINNLDLNEYEMICCQHPNKKKTKVVQEIEDIKANKLASTEQLDEMLNIMKTNNFKDNVGLTETSFLIRRHTKNIKRMNEEWTKMINVCPRDQVSFDYLKWKHNIFYNTIDPDYRPIFKVDHSDITNRGFNASTKNKINVTHIGSCNLIDIKPFPYYCHSTKEIIQHIKFLNGDINIKDIPHLNYLSDGN